MGKYQLPYKNNITKLTTDKSNMPTSRKKKTVVFIDCFTHVKLVRLALISWLVAASVSVSAQSTIYLLGEVHDNPKAHSERFNLFESLVAKKFRPVIAMEQFDRENQEILSQAMSSCKNADCVIRKAGGRGWEWNFYKPVIETALKLRLPIIAANLSSTDAMKIVRNGFGAALSNEMLREFNLDRPLDSELFQKQRIAIDNGHCNILPNSAFKGMINAQVARDVWMAKTIRENSANGLILLAGNGHVQKDIGVYRWLSDTERSRTEVIGFTEGDVETEKEAETRLYDRTIRVKPFERDDPCKAFTGRNKIQT
jgi:uncharacterized iron-regulated protein